MIIDHKKLNSVLENAGVSKTIYSLVMPETEAVVDNIIDGGVREEIIQGALTRLFSEQTNPDIETLTATVSQALDQARESFRDIYREAWTQKQDAMHEEFFEVWKDWNSPIVEADWSKFPFMYPTSGASEGLRAAINAYGAKARTACFDPKMHVFIGEYEGFSAYAAAAGIEVITHNRKDWRKVLNEVASTDQFYISQPSAIDGNVWCEFDEFAQALYESQPKTQLMLDLTYVGCVAKDFHVKADHPNIPTIFFSLSKPAGAYYHRIGGVLSREALPKKPELPDLDHKVLEMYPSLFGNKWFKNLLALRIGTEMMKNNGVHDLPRKYTPVQLQAMDQANKVLGFDLTPSDVFMLASMPPRDNPTDLEGYLTRGSQGEELVRVCLTPTMAHIIDSRVDATVKARPHEGLEIKEP